MAHFAKVNKNNVVEQVIVIDNSNAETEQAGKDFIASVGLEGNWIQTSYNANFRNKFAGLGDIYDPVKDVFVSDESYETNHTASWGGIFNPTSPSILFDAPARSANVWTVELLHQAFPSAFQRWGYINQHNPESFEKITHSFDCIATVVRNPIDSIASQAIMFKTNLTNNREVSGLIQKNIYILESIFKNKNNITIFTFETATQNPENLVSVVSNIINIDPQPFDRQYLVEKINSFSAGNEEFYSLPINNQNELNEIKTVLQQERFKDLMDKANDLYNKLLVYKEIA